MKHLLILLFSLQSIQSVAQHDLQIEPNVVFTPWKMAFGSRIGSFKQWNKQLDKYGYSELDMNFETSFEFSLYLKNNLHVKYLISIGDEKDSMFINDRFRDYKRRFYSLSFGYNLFSINKIGKYVVVPSLGVYTGRDRVLCKSRVPLNLYSYDVHSEYLYRYESGINPNLYISINPFSKLSRISLAGLGIDIGAFYNFNLQHKQQYQNSLNGLPIPNDRPITHYIKIGVEPYRGLLSYERPKKNKSPKKIESM